MTYKRRKPMKTGRQQFATTISRDVLMRARAAVSISGIPFAQIVERALTREVDAMESEFGRIETPKQGKRLKSGRPAA